MEQTARHSSHPRDDEARVTLTGRAATSPASPARVFTRPRRRERQRRHDHPERAGLGRPARRHLVHGRRATTCAPRPTALDAARRARPSEVETDAQIGKVSIVGAGMRSHPGVAAKVFTTLGDRGDQHRDDLDLADQDLLRDRRRSTCPTAVEALHEAFELGADAVREEDPRASTARIVPTRRAPGPLAMSADATVAVVGATGAVGSTMLEVLRRARASRPPRSSRSPPSARPARAIDFGGEELECRALSDDSIQGFDIVALLGRRRDQRRVGAALRRGRRRRRRQHQLLAHARGRAAGRPRGQPRRARSATSGIVANPNCTTMQMVVALAPIHRAAGIERLVVSTYQSVSGTGRQAIEELHEQTHAVLARRDARGRRGLPAPDRLQRAPAGRDLHGRRRLHDRGAQGDARDAQDPRRRRGADADLGDLRARPGRHRPLRVDQRRRPARPLSPEECRELLAAAPGVVVVDDAGRTGSTRWRSTPPAATRCSSAASAAIPRTTAASTSGSSATTCARARRRTRSRSPSCLIERDLVRAPAGASFTT